MSDQLKVVSDAHKAVMRMLEAWGINLMEEILFPPYTVDIYIPALHAAIEVDGKHHSAKKDRIRDTKLFAQYSLPVFRIRAIHALRPKYWRQGLIVFYKEFSDTAHERWEGAKDSLPWL